MCALILGLSFAINQPFVHIYLSEPHNSWQYCWAAGICGVQFSLASIYILLRTKCQSQQYGIFSSDDICLNFSVVYHILFCLPPIFHFAGLAVWVLEWLPLVSAVVTHMELVIALCLRMPHIIDRLERNIKVLRQLLRLHGIQLVVESQWVRLHVPTLLQTYWICKLVLDMIQVVSQDNVSDDDNEPGPLTFYDMDISPEHVHIYFEGEGQQLKENETSSFYTSIGYIGNTTLSVILRGCDGVIPLMGMTTVVSRITHYLGVFLALLVDSDNDDDKNMGTMCGILFFVLALQTGLTRLEPPKRLIRLYRNMCLLSTAILHFTHSMIHPLLMNVSASRAAPMSKHIRVLSMCIFLLVFPAVLLYYLWTRNIVSPWLLAVTAFSVEVMIKVIISLLIYGLFMIDSHHETFWEELDDYIYYIKATGNMIEFMFGIFLFCNGAWIMVFESGGMIRAVMMCIHAYYNIWIQACEGWKVFMQRRSAVHKINSLPEATQQELEQLNDICSICHENLETARITRCHHFFHSVCLRKWLYNQDSCPLCHKPIYQPSDNDSELDNDLPPQAQNGGFVNRNHHPHVD